MTTDISPYLHLTGQAREAIEFYGDVFGATPTITGYDDLDVPSDPADAGKVMHAAVELPTGGTLMAADVPTGMPRPSGASVAVALFGDHGDRELLRAAFARLSDGGTDVLPMAVAPWGDEFGMCTDRFGTSWLVDVAPAEQG